jgi:hypothetical protein
MSIIFLFAINIAYRTEGCYNKNKKGKSMRMHYHLKYLVLVCMVLLTCYPLYSDISQLKIKISVEEANVRLEPASESPIVLTLAKGAVLDSYEKTGEWFRVVIGPDEKGFSLIGYLHSSDVEVIEEKIIKEPDFWEEEPEFFEGIGLRVKLSGGLSFFGSGDIDKGTRGFFDSTADLFFSSGYTIDKRPESFGPALDVSGDIIFNIKPQIGIGLGTSYIHASGKNFFLVSGKELYLEQQVGSIPKINVISIRLGGFFTLPIQGLFSIRLNGGPSLYLAKYSYAMETDIRDITDIFHKATAQTLGFHGGLGLAIDLTKRSVFFIEGQGRYAKISNFEGEGRLREHVDSSEVNSTEKGTLYYVEDGKYSYLTIRKEEPSGFMTVRKATFDLSGISLRAGLIIKF